MILSIDDNLLTIAAIVLFLFLVLPLALMPCTEESSQGEHLAGSPRTITLHYTNWCHYCKNMKPVWAAVKQQYNGRIKFAEIDEDIAHTPGITSYPTIIMRDERGNIRKYDGAPVVQELSKWAIN